LGKELNIGTGSTGLLTHLERQHEKNTMTEQIALTLVVLVAAIILFSIERFPADVTALGILVTLILLGLLPVEQAFMGFGSDAVILILGLLIMTAALVRTGVVEIAGQWIVRYTGDNSKRLLGVFLVAPAIMSAFMSNTASTAFFLPIAVSMARRARFSVSKLLMPLAFATILASSVTLVATSTNIVVSGLIVQKGMAPLGLFELAPVGVPILIVGLIYMYTIGQRLIPDRREAEIEQRFGSHTFFTETVILPDSPLAGKTLAQTGLGRDMDLTVVRIIRDRKKTLVPQADMVVHEGDVLMIEGHRDEILKLMSKNNVGVKSEVRLDDLELQTDNVGVVEAVVLNRSPMIGRTLRGLSFRERFGLQVLAINRHGETIHHKIGRTSIRLGDVLLVHGNQTNIIAMEEERVFRVLSSVDHVVPNSRRAPIAVGAFLGALVLAGLNVLALPVAIMLAVVVAFLARCITPEEAYREVEWKALILIGSMLGLGIAMEYTGSANFLATRIIDLVGNTSPIWLLTGFFGLTMLLTQPMSNQAAAVVVVPIAIQTALQLGLNPRTFAAMIAVGASCSFLTPLEPACLMVYGAGDYRFIDFLKVGALLTVLIYLIAILLVPLIWPL
jgi:di/tricarboxylate transporter